MKTSARVLERLEHQIYEALMGGLIEHYRARLAEKQGRHRLARWSRRQLLILERGLVVALLSPGAGYDERRRIFSRCRDYVQSRDPVVRGIVTSAIADERASIAAPVLEDGDAEAYWARVAAVAEPCLECGCDPGAR